MKRVISMICTVVMLLNIFNCIVFAEGNNEPKIEWENSLGGSDNDVAYSIQQTVDGGYIVAGYSSSRDGDVTGNHGGQDYWIVKLDSVGQILWQKNLGGSNNDVAQSIQQTIDGGYIVAGYATSTDGDVTGNHGGQDYWIVKLDSNGNTDWENSLGGSNNDVAYSIQQTTDGGYIIAGKSQSMDGDITGNHGGQDYWIVKLDSTGQILWEKSLGGSDDEIALSIQQTVDGGYIVAGCSTSMGGDVTGNYGGQDYWIVKLDSVGQILWQKNLGGSNNDVAQSIQQTIDGGYIVAGNATSTDGGVTGNHGSYDFWIVKLDSTGQILWQNSLGGSKIECPSSIEQTADGGYIIAGYASSTDGDVTGNHGAHDCWIVKLDSLGQMLWQNNLGGSNGEIAYSIEQTTDGGYILSGNSSSRDGDVTGNHGGSIDFWIVKLSGEGEAYNYYNLNVAAENGKVTKIPNKEIYKEGEIVTLIATPDEGYKFVGWSGDISNSTNRETSFSIVKNTVVEAYFEEEIIYESIEAKIMNTGYVDDAKNRFNSDIQRIYSMNNIELPNIVVEGNKFEIQIDSPEDFEYKFYVEAFVSSDSDSGKIELLKRELHPSNLFSGETFKYTFLSGNPEFTIDIENMFFPSMDV